MDPQTPARLRLSVVCIRSGNLCTAGLQGQWCSLKRLGSGQDFRACGKALSAGANWSPRLKPILIPFNLSGPEGPLFHGSANFTTRSAACSGAPKGEQRTGTLAVASAA